MSHGRDRDGIGNLLRELRHGGRRAIESTGEIVGALAAPVFAVTSTLRRARTFHPRGDCANAVATACPDVPPPYRALARRLEGNVLVRFSDALTKGNARWPDVLGCALRFAGESEDAADGDQDLLFATIKRPWTMPFSPLTTKVRDYLANDYFAVSPFAIRDVLGEPLDTRVWFRLQASARGGAERAVVERPPTGSPDALLSSASGEAASHPRAERRRERLEAMVAADAATFVLGVAEGPWGPFAPVIELRLVSVRPGDLERLRFNPFRSGRGVEPQGFVHSLRRGVYAASQRARSTVT